MKNTHSPFHVIPDFISPAVCDEIIKSHGLKTPSFETDGETPIKNERILKDEFLEILKGAIADNAEEIEKRYGASIKGMDEPRFLQFYEDPKNPCVKHGCENARLSRKKWVKVKDVDIVGYLWLKDYQDSSPLDPRFEVYGGKLEFPVHNFSLIPQRGTCVIFPAGPHFITAVSHVFVGSLEYIKFSLKLMVNSDTGEQMWLYQPFDYPGTFTDWFI